MVDITTNGGYYVDPALADLRRDVAASTGQILQEDMKGFGNTRFDVADSKAQLLQENLKGFDRVNADVLRSGWQNTDVTKDVRHDIISHFDGIHAANNQQAAQFFIAAATEATNAAREVAALKSQADATQTKLSADILQAAALGQAATALESQKLGAAIALAQASTDRLVVAEGVETRRLINELKYGDLNRALIERNTELVEEREGRRHWRGEADFNRSQGQWAAVSSQLQAFGSQLQEVRQGTVNFGTMSGNAGRNTSTNNVV